MSRRKADCLDQVDAELIRETTQSPGWQLIKRGIENILTQKVRDLVRPCSEVETASLRGEIQAMETVLKLPEILARKGQAGAPSDG